jgi:DNA repair exonuclease SbcCD ATPase subunit
MTWFLEQISIEGFRGINNAGAPLELKFDPDKVNSVFAPNGVGKSSIFEAVSYVLTGGIPKLDALSSLRGAKRRSNPSFLYADRWIASLRSQ